MARPAAFLDRDGVINVDSGFPHRPEQLVFTATAVEAIRLLNRSGYLAIVVTNQSGVARGLFEIRDVERFHDHMQAELARHDAHIDAYYYCAFHPNGAVPEFASDHEDRKPNPGMVLRAMAEWDVRRDGSFLIGDRQSDVEAAERAGIPGVLVASNECDLAAEVRRLIA